MHDIYKCVQWSLMLSLGCRTADRDGAAANIGQPRDYATDDNGAARYGNSTDDGRTARHGSVRHGVADARSTAADGSKPASDDGRTWTRGQRRRLEFIERRGCSPVAAGHIYTAFGGECARSAARRRTTGCAAAAAENNLVWCVLFRLRKIFFYATNSTYFIYVSTSYLRSSFGLTSGF